MLVDKEVEIYTQYTIEINHEICCSVDRTRGFSQVELHQTKVEEHKYNQHFHVVYKEA